MLIIDILGALPWPIPKEILEAKYAHKMVFKPLPIPPPWTQEQIEAIEWGKMFESLGNDPNKPPFPDWFQF